MQSWGEEPQQAGAGLMLINTWVNSFSLHLSFWVTHPRVEAVNSQILESGEPEKALKSISLQLGTASKEFSWRVWGKSVHYFGNVSNAGSDLCTFPKIMLWTQKCSLFETRCRKRPAFVKPPKNNVNLRFWLPGGFGGCLFILLNPLFVLCWRSWWKNSN